MMKYYIMPVLAVLIVFMILLVLPVKDSFKLTSAELMKRIGDNDFIITAAEFKMMKEEGAMLVDLSMRQNFKDHHLPEAVNLPLEELNVDMIREFFRESGTYVLYNEDLTLACQAWMLVTRMGFDHVFVLKTDTDGSRAIENQRFMFIPETSGEE